MAAAPYRRRVIARLSIAGAASWPATPQPRTSARAHALAASLGDQLPSLAIAQFARNAGFYHTRIESSGSAANIGCNGLGFCWPAQGARERQVKLMDTLQMRQKRQAKRKKPFWREANRTARWGAIAVCVNSSCTVDQAQAPGLNDSLEDGGKQHVVIRGFNRISSAMRAARKRPSMQRRSTHRLAAIFYAGREGTGDACQGPC
jgi:hypothetical protein